MSNLFRRSAMCLTALTILVYLVYRAFVTLNLSGPFAVLFSITLYAAELYGAGLLMLYFFNIWELSEPPFAPPLLGRTVDVMIPTYNEDPNILRGTISAALAIEYPHRTYVLDDSRRPEVEQLAAELGAIYIRREDNIHAKAGNLNHALEQTDGEFVVIFDADQLSAPTFVSRLIGYFIDDRLAFVQTPHAFYNFDSYQARLDYKRRRYWEDGELFYNLVQPGKNRWNAAMFCGSAAIFRRSALLDVGLIATETITEDMHTGLRLHAKGWKSLFINERLISALAAPDITAFLSQRLRWGEGNLGVFFYDNPITMRGLTLAQRLSYVGSILCWTTGLQKLILYLTPAIMLFTAVAPVKELNQTLAIMTLSYLAAIWIGVKLVSDGHSRLIAEELGHMTCFWTQCRSMYRAVVNRKRARFVVTSKRGRQSSNIGRHIAPHLLYIALVFAAIAWAGVRYYFGLMQDTIGLAVGASLLTVHGLFAWDVISRGLRRPDRRYSWRHPCAAHVSYDVATEEGNVSGQAVTVDLNERGVSVVAFQPLPKSELLRLTISAGGTTTDVHGRIVQEMQIAKGRAGMHGATTAYRYGIQFEDPSTEQLADLWRVGGGYAVARQYERFKPQLLSPDDDCAGRDRSALDASLPVTFEVANEEMGICRSVTEWLSGDKFACFLPQRLGDDARRRFRIDTPFGPVSGDATVGCVTERNVAGRALFMHRFEVRQFTGQSRGVVQTVLQNANRRATREAIAPIPGVQNTPLLHPLAVSVVLGSMVTVAVVVASMIVSRDQITLVRLAQGENGAPRDIALLDGYADKAAAGEITDRKTLDLIFAGLHRFDRNDKLYAIWESPKANASMTADERLARAQIRAGTGHYVEAEEDFHWLLEHIGDPRPNGLSTELLPELYLSSARNSYNVGNQQAAIVRYGEAFHARSDDPQLAAEYAGVLLTANNVREAITVLKSVPQDNNGKMLLASAYVREKDFSGALAIYREMLRIDPSSASLNRDVADVTAWSEDFTSAAALYLKLLERSPEDSELKNRLALAYLGGHQYDSALVVLRALSGAQSSDPQWQQAYLDAAASAEQLTAQDRKIAQTISDDVTGDLAHRKPEFLARLTDVLARLKDGARIIPVLQWRVDAEPDDRGLRRRLADALSDAGRYQEAEVHYRLLLTRLPSETPRAIVDPTATP